MKKKLPMDAYYYSFTSTGVKEIDKILSAVACAGQCFHHTSDWSEDFRDTYHKGKTPIEWIQNAANEAAKKLKMTPAQEKDE